MPRPPVRLAALFAAILAAPPGCGLLFGPCDSDDFDMTATAPPAAIMSALSDGLLSLAECMALCDSDGAPSTSTGTPTTGDPTTTTTTSDPGTSSGDTGSTNSTYSSTGGSTDGTSTGGSTGGTSTGTSGTSGGGLLRADPGQALFFGTLKGCSAVQGSTCPTWCRRGSSC